MATILIVSFSMILYENEVRTWAQSIVDVTPDYIATGDLAPKAPGLRQHLGKGQGKASLPRSSVGWREARQRSEA